MPLQPAAFKLFFNAYSFSWIIPLTFVTQDSDTRYVEMIEEREQAGKVLNSSHDDHNNKDYMCICHCPPLGGTPQNFWQGCATGFSNPESLLF